ncbi:uncharacterized protein HMPREF1541_07321 [Cyphellophora europaea CBS 101466]|uniref:Uncharacterized protein n=1 Tax=Cyphellophora europaea (strain CBS 101466) TaxID=1220924 RepID=W2RPR3_CYPE1|nr:uncharacterized protein HMPREF1541_07321 [Cyphellophora europaea CBS 101466]ETN37698.1 hypothetical protein HMPREF1541_07321 [Cyphellophora europaea CBS 101466]
MHIPPPPPRGVDTRNTATANRARPLSVSALSQVVTHSGAYNQTRPPIEEVIPSPPAARRAVSADAISNSGSSIPSREPSDAGSSRNGWHPGMPLPGPPPGPPPGASRSQSLDAASGTEEEQKPLQGTARHGQAYRVPLRVPLLSPMPPTPAGWTEDQPMHSYSRSPVPLQIRTTNLDQAGPSRFLPILSESAGDSSSATRSSSGLNRSAAVRDSSVKGLRERRSLRKSITDSDTTNLAALVVDTNNWPSSSRDNGIVNSPAQLSESRVSGKAREDDFRAMDANRPSTSRSASFSRRARADLALSPLQYDHVNSPRSPMPRIHKLQTGSNTPMHGNKPLPTPPLSQKAPTSAQSLMPSSNASLPDFDREYGDKLAADSLNRHRDFLAKESQAANDEERLQIFADYIIGESVLRRRRYSGARQVDILRIRQRLFDENDPAAVAALRPSAATSATEESKSRPETMWWKDFQPALSPIASMSNDEMSSRGRTSSRWWESHTGGSQDDTGPVRRSKRESKYMGLSTSLMNTMLEEADTPSRLPDSGGFLGPEEYPEEKVDPGSFGVYADRERSQDSMTIQGSPGLMDVSRFITLPPPYPRHYPAVNNSHPQLSTYRLTVRSLSDLSEIKSRKARHQISIEALRNEHKQKIGDSRQHFKNNIQAQIAEGSISYAEAAEAEAALRVEEQSANKKCLQAEFDTLQDVVINPLHDMLNDRLVQLNTSIDELSSKILTDAAEHNPDRPQEEGDDTPELLEYLTQLKWLFETRETVHKEIFDLLTERNEKYKEIVVLPYRQANNNEKARETEAFFARDNAERRRVFCEESMQRHQQLYQIVEDNVETGVEMQSSAFWDIAPALVDLLQKLSAQGDVEHWDRLAISEQEYLENPSYHRFPQQYLYTLLDHAEKSSYQFIEGQVNLHCLLHEVKNGRLIAECRKAEVDGQNPADWEEHRMQQEAILTTELKQKVGIIEEQWADALGNALQEAKEKIQSWLQVMGGWEDMENANAE